MNTRTIAVILLCSAALLASTGTLQAQEDHLIENQRDVLIIDDTAWGDTYIGKYTSGNSLFLVDDPEVIKTNGLTLTSGGAYVGYSSSASNNYVEVSLSNATWQVSSLNIGTSNNADNIVYIGDYGTVEVQNGVSIAGASNLNGLVLGPNGTLYVKSDFDASMAGFVYTNATLEIGGELSGMDNVSNAMSIVITGTENGTNATWNVDSGTLTVGSLDDNNNVLLESDATLTTSNLWIGGLSTTGNTFVVDSGARAHIQTDLQILNSGNFLQVTNGGILEVDMDFNATMSGLELQYGGILEAHGDLIMDELQDGASLLLSGTNAAWLSRSGLNLAMGTETNDSTMRVTDGAVVRAGTLEIGAASTSSNNVRITNGGEIVIENTGSTVNGDNALWLTDGGKLTFEGDYSMLGDGSFYWGNGGILEVQGEFPVFTATTVNNDFIEFGTLFLQRGKILILNGTNATWNGALHNLHVGDLSHGNALILTNGATATVNSMTIGDFAEGGNNNQVVVTETGSVLSVLGDIELGGRMMSGNWADGGTSNVITVGNGAILSSTGTLHNRNSSGTSGLVLEQGSTVDVQNYYQANGSYLLYNLESTPTNAGRLVAHNTAEFEEGASIGFTSVSGLSFDASYTNLLVEADTLVIGGITNATSSDLKKLDLTSNTLMNFVLFESDQDIYAIMNRLYLSQSAGFSEGSMMWDIANEIDRLSLNGNSAAANQIDILNGISGSQQHSELNQLYAYQMPTYMHNQGVFSGIDQIIARGSSFHGASGALPRPTGAKGPHDANQGLQGWAKAYGGFGSRDKDNFNDGYDAQIFGTVLGLDQAFDQWLFGIAGGYAGSTLDGDNGDESQATTGYGMLYASYGTEDWFGDLVVSYGLSDIDNTSGGAFDVESNTDASHTAFYIGGGKEFKDPDGSDALLRPLLALQISQYDQDSYTEKSSNAVAKDVDGYDRWSYQSIFGAEMVLPAEGTKVDIETQLRAYWLHEFNDDEEKVGYTLVGSTQPGQFVLRSPESDVAQFGVGCVAQWDNGLQLRADLDCQVGGDFFGTTLSGALRYEF